MNARGEISIGSVAWAIIFLFCCGAYFSTGLYTALSATIGTMTAQIMGTLLFLAALYMLAKPSPIEQQYANLGGL